MGTIKHPNGAVLIPFSSANGGKATTTSSAAGTWEEYNPDAECDGPVGTPKRQCPHVRRDNAATSDNKQRLVHINIASYRDPLCPNTLLSIFYHAVDPNAIRVRLLQQNDGEANDDGDVDCVEKYCELATKMKGTRRGNVARIAHHGDCPHSDQIQVRRTDAAKAAGPMHARGFVGEALSDAHARGEVDTQDFCLSVDSHMEFGHDWDRDMIDMFALAGNEYAILSTRPPDLDQLQRANANDDSHEVPHLCSVTFTSNVRMGETTIARNLSKPKLTNGVWSAALSFSKCHAELKVPIDTQAPNVFDGDEFNRAVRFWTHGYDIYTPHRVIIAHDYGGSRNNTFAMGWRNNDDASWNNILHKSQKRLKTVIGLPGGDIDEKNALQLQKSKFGLGDRRTIEQYIDFSGIDVGNNKMVGDEKKRCGNLQWIPFSEHPSGADYIPRFHDTTFDPIDDFDETSIWHGKHSKIQGAIQTSNDDDGTGEVRNIVKHFKGEKGGLPHDGEKSKVAKDAIHFQPGITPQKKMATKRLGHPTAVKRHHAGLHKLPLMVQLSVVILILGVAFSIWLSKGTGVGRRKFLARRKRDV